MSDYEIREGELAGFDLAGWRYPSGVVQINSSKRFIDDWPQEITFHGATYTLEEVQPGAVDEKTGARWENAIYV